MFAAELLNLRTEGIRSCGPRFKLPPELLDRAEDLSSLPVWVYMPQIEIGTADFQRVDEGGLKV